MRLGDRRGKSMIWWMRRGRGHRNGRFFLQKDAAIRTSRFKSLGPNVVYTGTMVSSRPRRTNRGCMHWLSVLFSFSFSVFSFLFIISVFPYLEFPGMESWIYWLIGEFQSILSFLNSFSNFWNGDDNCNLYAVLCLTPIPHSLCMSTRFDGRALLDFIRDADSRRFRQQEKTLEEEEVEEFVNFERYRDLIKHRRRGCRYFLIYSISIIYFIISNYQWTRLLRFSFWLLNLNWQFRRELIVDTSVKVETSYFLPRKITLLFYQL